MNKKGFTLIEMVVAIVIISILASLAIPGTLKYIREYQDEKYIVDARKIYMEAQIFVVKKRVQYNVKDIKSQITYDSCLNMGERTLSFEDAISDLYLCEKKTTIYPVDGVSVEINEQFQVEQFKVDYNNNGKVKTVAFDKDGNASIFDSD